MLTTFSYKFSGNFLLSVAGSFLIILLGESLFPWSNDLILGDLKVEEMAREELMLSILPRSLISSCYSLEASLYTAKEFVSLSKLDCDLEMYLICISKMRFCYSSYLSFDFLMSLALSSIDLSGSNYIYVVSLLAWAV